MMMAMKTVRPNFPRSSRIQLFQQNRSSFLPLLRCLTELCFRHLPRYNCNHHFVAHVFHSQNQIHVVCVLNPLLSMISTTRSSNSLFYENSVKIHTQTNTQTTIVAIVYFLNAVYLLENFQEKTNSVSYSHTRKHQQQYEKTT